MMRWVFPFFPAGAILLTAVFANMCVAFLAEPSAYKPFV